MPLGQGPQNLRRLFFQALKNPIDGQPVFWHTKSQDELDFHFVQSGYPPFGFFAKPIEDSPIFLALATPLLH